MTSTKAKRSVSNEHKAALANGRAERKIVSNYLNALEEMPKPKRGRKRTVETISNRIAKIELGLKDGFDPFAKGSGVPLPTIRRLHMLQELMDLRSELDAKSEQVRISELSDLKDAFVPIAKSYSERFGLSKAAWLAIGVPESVLKEAGITR